MTRDIAEGLRAALDWIDAIPSEVVATLPAMPGFDRDYVEGLLSCPPTLPADRAGEAVAWRYRSEGAWRFCRKMENARDLSDAGFEIERLYLRPLPDPPQPKSEVQDA